MIESNDRQAAYTIETCKVDREYLNDYRKKIWDDLVKDLESEILDAANANEARNNVMVIVRKFRRDAEQNPKNEFLAFRRFVIQNFLAEKIREVLS